MTATKSLDIFVPGSNTQNAGSWNNWDDRSFGIETKIEEYRAQRLASSSEKETAKKEETDYFLEMQPKIKAPKEVFLGD